ncbi:MAG: hypothetical protein IJ840_01725 [Bacteroidales bacterium]|nr:hypothetical protein [Bacteroidales bacterium]
MRKFVITLIAISFAAIANAQIYAGGSLALSTNSDAETTAVSIVPEVGYAVNAKFSVGASLGLNTYSISGGGSTNVIAVKPYVRYNFIQAGPVSFFTDAAFMYMKPKNVDGSWEIGLYPGIAAPISGNLSAVAHLGALAYNSDTTFGIGLSNVASAGIYYSF